MHHLFINIVQTSVLFVRVCTNMFVVTLGEYVQTKLSKGKQ